MLQGALLDGERPTIPFGVSPRSITQAIATSRFYHCSRSCSRMRRVWVDAQRPRMITPPVVGRSPLPGTSEHAQYRFAVACMTKRPLDFITWLKYHYEITGTGVDHFFLRVSRDA